MDIDGHEVRDLLARYEIRDCIARIARGEDRRNAALIEAGYWHGARLDLGIFAGSLAEYLSWVVPGSPAIAVTQHVLGQSVIDLRIGTAFVETQVTSYHRIITDDGHRDATLGGRYLDCLEQRGGTWRIADRTMLYDWSRDDGESVDWSHGVMGMPLSAEHYVGRAVGDHSETLFGEGWPA
jgi:SnoaL-like domain